MTWLTHNWEYKLIAVFFAVALFFYTSDLISIDRRIRVSELTPASVRLPPEFVVTAIEPPFLEVTLRGPKNLVTALPDVLTPKITLEPERLQMGGVAHLVQVTPHLLQIDPKILVQSVSPQPQIRVTVAQLDRKTVRISERIEVKNKAPGLTVSIRLEQTDVQVFGPRGALHDLAQIEVERLDLADIPPDLDREMERKVPINLILPAGVRLAEGTSRIAIVTLRPEAASRVVSLPVQVVAPPGFWERYTLTLAQNDVAVTVRGPSALLDALKPAEQAQALIVAGEAWPLDEPQSVPVRILGPTWMSAAPVQVRVTLGLRQAPAPAPVPAPAPAPPPVPALAPPASAGP